MAISVQLIVILIVFVVISLFASEQTMWKVLLALLVMVPSTVQGLISGAAYSTAGILNLSMVGYSTMAAGIVLMLRHGKLERKTSITLLGCFAVILMVRMIADGMDFVSNKLFDNYFLPMLFAILLISNIKSESIPKLLKFMYYCILIGAAIACIEYIYGQSLFFHQYYMDTCPWYKTIYISSQYVAFRSCSFFGHPLIGAIYYLVGVVYLLNVISTKDRKLSFLLQFSLLTLAILSTNSRSALLGLALYLAYFLIKKKKIGKLMALLFVALSLMLFVDWKSLYYLMFARDNNGSSFMVRVNAILSLVDIPIESLIMGEGYNNTSSLLNRLGFVGNVEISYLIILMENGIIGFGAWLVSIFHFFRRKPRLTKKNSMYVSAVQGMLICLFVVGGMSNSFGDPGTLNYLIYILLAFNYILAKRSIEECVAL